MDIEGKILELQKQVEKLVSDLDEPLRSFINLYSNFEMQLLRSMRELWQSVSGFVGELRDRQLEIEKSAAALTKRVEDLEAAVGLKKVSPLS